MAVNACTVCGCTGGDMCTCVECGKYVHEGVCYRSHLEYDHGHYYNEEEV